MTRLGRRLRLLLRRRSVQAGLALLAVPAAWGTYRLAVPHYQGRPITAYVRDLASEALDEPRPLYGQHTEPASWWAFEATRRVDLAVDALDHPDPRTRAGACRVLAAAAVRPGFEAELRRAQPSLVRLIVDQSPQVRFHAAFVLGCSADSTAVPALVAAVGRPDAEGHFKTVAAESIASLTREPDALAVAHRALVEAVEDPRSRGFAVWLASLYLPLQGAEVIERLVRLLGEEPATDSEEARRVRDGAYYALLGRSDLATVDVRVTQALLRDLCDAGEQRAGSAELWVARDSAPLKAAVRAAVQLEGPEGHDCPQRRHGRPCGREVWYVKRMIETGR